MANIFNPLSGSVFFLKRFEKRVATEPLSVLKVSSSQQKIFKKAQQIKTFLPYDMWTISNPLGEAGKPQESVIFSLEPIKIRFYCFRRYHLSCDKITLHVFESPHSAYCPCP
ncbi:hypothetical protein AVEN_49737-1 [Araneus ventricosus]|uniref:Uncharacterized protein n=1 Tax=Araneus ventricosus TaxID=182803 RepID=A0A4Y2FCB7_ARAVE|nr:hypothetical protein AVEN_49737-1 [Araneus ventricosus]